MSVCDEYRIQALCYLDGNLEGLELENFRAHLEVCSECRSHLAEERELSQVLHASRPLYAAPNNLQARVRAMMSDHHAASGYYSRNISKITHRLQNSVRRVPRARILIPATVIVLFCLAAGPGVVRQVRAANYVEAAVTTHQSYVNGTIRLEFSSNSPNEVTAWLNSRLPFSFRLPDAQAAALSNPIYRLTGASLVHYKGNPAGLVTYETVADKISLLVVSGGSAVVSGGDEVRLGKLTFHYHNEGQFKVITWNVHDLSYALVSSISSPARASCLVCHQHMADKSSFTTRQ